MRYTDFIGSQDDCIEHQTIKPKYHPCPQCGKKGKMIVFLSWENVECTNNHVERNNRVFRMLQKTRYKRRRTHTLEKALELDLYARMLKHPLYRQKVKNRPNALKGPPPLKKAA